jgi:hypothetical protein
MNGWEAGVLEKAIAEQGGCNCGCACGQTEIEQCFGADNVNKDDDKAWASCSAMTAYGGDDGSHIEGTLPGCNPLQYGPSAATAATGAGCTAAAAPVSSKVSASSAAASQTSAIAVSSAVNSDVTPDASSAVYSNTSSAAYPTTSAVADAVSPTAYSAALPVVTSSKSTKTRKTKTHASTATAFPSLAVDLPNKQVDDATACTDPATVYKTLTEQVTVTVTASVY